MDNHAKNILKSILSYLNINYNSQWHKEHQELLNYPSFLSFHHLLKKHGINSIAIKSNVEQLNALPVPLLIHMHKGKFALIVQIEGDHIQILEKPKHIKTITKQDIESIWDGYVLIFDKDNIQQEKKSWRTCLVAFFKKKKLISIICCILILFCILLYQKRNVYNLFYLFYSICGISISTLYIIRQYSRNTPFIQKICPTTKTNKINCSAILDSKAAYFFNLFAWSDFSFIYFSTLLTILLFFSNQATISIISVIIFIASGYIFYSLYYQIFIAKKWCILCLIMMPVLLFGGITSIFFFRSGTFQINFSFSYILSLLLAIFYSCLYSIFFTYYKKYTHYKILKHKYQSLKFHPQIIELLFQKQPHVNTSQLKTICLTPQHKHENCLTIVFNPTCTPCITKLQYLLQLIAQKEQTKLELILFTNSDKSSDSYLAAQYLVQAYITAPSNFNQLLHNYISKYPTNINTQIILNQFENSLSDKLINTHRKWCMLNHITTTPVLFLNYTLLPPEYTLEDIDYICH
ncbi:MAG: cysteine peptidase family C39 domain-containing protein [Oscillibacter sp.]|nr:cysteine peptidase family C39 domain-containing protein [Oscillibacter sp.]